LLIVLVGAAACAACAKSPAPAAPPETRAERVAVLDRIAADCGLPRAALVLMGEDQLQFRPARDAGIERVDCVLRKIQAANVRLQTAPAANETQTPEANNAQTH